MKRPRGYRCAAPALPCGLVNGFWEWSGFQLGGFGACNDFGGRIHTPTPMEACAKQLTTANERLGLSHKDVPDRVGFYTSPVSKCENTKQNPDGRIGICFLTVHDQIRGVFAGNVKCTSLQTHSGLLTRRGKWNCRSQTSGRFTGGIGIDRPVCADRWGKTLACRLITSSCSYRGNADAAALHRR